MQVNYLVEILRLDNNGIDYVGANYIGDMLTINVYITTLVRVNFPPLHYDIYIAIIVVLELLSLRRKWLVVHQITVYIQHAKIIPEVAWPRGCEVFAIFIYSRPL